jgi:hypothetical protein
MWGIYPLVKQGIGNFACPISKLWNSKNFFTDGTLHIIYWFAK